MKPLAFNLKNAKKISGDQHTSTFEVGQGHKITILHKALPAFQRKQLSELPLHESVMKAPSEGKQDVTQKLMAKGGTITPAEGMAVKQYADSDELVSQDDSAPQAFMPSGGPTVEGPSGEAQENPQQPPKVMPPQEKAQASIAANLAKLPPEADQAPESQAAPGNQQAPNQQQLDSLTQQLTSSNNPLLVQNAYEQGQHAIQEQKKVDAALASQEAIQQANDLSARQDLLDSFQQNSKDFAAHQQQFMQDYANEHIDPNHYMESQTSGQKVATAIGLFLGGLSTPFTRQGNPALDFINRQIDRDIQAQQANLGQKRNLLEANQALYHDYVLANNATRMNLNDIYARQVQLAASKLGTPQAQARADALSSQFALQNAGLLQQSALRATIYHSMAQGGQGLTAIDLGNAGLIPPQEAQKEQSSIDAQKRAIDSAKQLYGQMNKEQTTLNLANPQSYSRLAAQHAQLVNAIMEASPSKRLTRESVEQEINPMMIKTTDTPTTRLQKLQGMMNIIKNHADPTPHMQEYAPNALPNYNLVPPGLQEGAKGIHKSTGEPVIFTNGQWRKVR